MTLRRQHVFFILDIFFLVDLHDFFTNIKDIYQDKFVNLHKDIRDPEHLGFIIKLENLSFLTIFPAFGRFGFCPHEIDYHIQGTSQREFIV